jgi:hypothetical protein
MEKWRKEVLGLKGGQLEDFSDIASPLGCVQEECGGKYLD